MTGLGYTVPAVASVAVVCVWELAVLRTGLFRRPSYWAAVAIVLAFQIPVDGWLTKLSAPIVRYAPGQMTGLRFPWDIPIEDFLYGFSLVTAALLLWERVGRWTGRGQLRSTGYSVREPGNGERATVRTIGTGLRREGAVLRPGQVVAAFDVGAPAYDRLVGANPGYHEHLRMSARRMRLPGDGRGLRLLDAGCGTGASTAALLAAAPGAEIVAIDSSGEMLFQARAKSWPSSVHFVHARMEDLAEAGVHGPFDGILAAYLIRNLADPDGQLRALRDLLRPGATLAVHEYSVRDSVRARAIWHAVCWSVIIPFGRLVTGDTALYRYLWRSVNDFDGARRFRQRLRDAGFTAVHSETMTGWQRDVVHTFLATAPAGDGAVG